MADLSPNIVLLQASVDPDDVSEFRVLVDGKSVKYITIDPGLYDSTDMCFGPSLVSLLPPLPCGDWNKAHISRDPETDHIRFSAVSKAHLAGITNTWHPTQVDHLQLRDLHKLRTNVYEATCPGFSSAVIAKFARFEWEVPQLQAETAAYEWIEGQQIGPDFLGHLTEEGRVIGFLIARVAGCRHAAPEDLPQCARALAKLHRLGIRHGDVNRHNFLVCDEDGRATLVDFDCAARPAGDNELAAEMQELEAQLRDSSGRGGWVVEGGPP